MLRLDSHLGLSALVMAGLLTVPAATVRANDAPATGNTATTKTDTDPVVLEYPLDDVSRDIPAHGRVHCPKVEMIRYRGSIIRYHKPVYIYVGFRDRLEKFEKLVRDVAIEVYGRAPRRIRHLGTYNCRRIRAWPDLVSEHGLGNGIDVEGFDFGWVSRKKAPNVPRKLRRAFRVRLLKHWNSTKGMGKLHSRFLRTLAQRMIEAHGMFRVMLGPAEPGHQNHFHLDVAPWRVVNIF